MSQPGSGDEPVARTCEPEALQHRPLVPAGAPTVIRQTREQPSQPSSFAAPCGPDRCGGRSAEERALAGLPTEQIRDALTALPDDVRHTLYLVDLAGLSYREVGAILGIPRRKVLSRVHRGRSNMRWQLAGISQGSWQAQDSEQAQGSQPAQANSQPAHSVPVG